MYMVVSQNLVRNAGGITEKAAFLRFGEQRFSLHWELKRSLARAVADCGTQDELSGMRLDFGIDTLIGAGNQGVAFFQLSIDSPVASRPIAVLAKEADAPRYENLHYDSSSLSPQDT